MPELDNLHRLGLIVYGRNIPTTLGSISDEGAEISGVRFTKFGWDFVQAVRAPGRAPVQSGQALSPRPNRRRNNTALRVGSIQQFFL